MTEAVIVIPARYGSTRFPGKPLQALKDRAGVTKTLIHRSWEAATEAARGLRVVVATDDTRIARHVEHFGGEVVMTSTDCANGTERCAEAALYLDESCDVIVNFQGDAPLTPAWFVDALLDTLDREAEIGVATPVLRCDDSTLSRLRKDRRNDRVGATTSVFGATGRALYFSKEIVPFVPGSGAGETPVFHHVGVYAYRREALESYARWPRGPLERAEGLEQLRFLENGSAIRCVEISARGRHLWELNNPEDIPVIERLLP